MLLVFVSHYLWSIKAFLFWVDEKITGSKFVINLFFPNMCKMTFSIEHLVTSVFRLEVSAGQSKRQNQIGTSKPIESGFRMWNSHVSDNTFASLLSGCELWHEIKPWLSARDLALLSQWRCLYTNCLHTSHLDRIILDSIWKAIFKLFKRSWSQRKDWVLWIL